jgi:hypothetical protein
MMPFDSDPEMRVRYETFMNYVSEALHAGQERMDGMDQNIAANTEAIQKNTEAQAAHMDATREMVDAFNAMKGGMKVLEQIGRIGRVIGGMAAGGAAMYGAYQAVIKYFK